MEDNQEIRRFAYKGFNSDLTCRKYKYNVGETHVYNGYIQLCSGGFHYCYKLSDVFGYYPRKNSSFAIVEILGRELKSSDKACTDRIKIVKELSEEEIDDIILREEEDKLDNEVFKLDVVRELQLKLNMYIGGSTALYLYGLVLDKKEDSDLDLVMPYYQRVGDIAKKGELLEEAGEFDGKKSGNDYDFTYGIVTREGKFVKLDVRIDPKQSYEIVEYKGFPYKVCRLMDILEAKCRYAKEGNTKHLRDIKSLLKFRKTSEEKVKQNSWTDLDELFK